jgi:hypothetical protein
VPDRDSREIGDLAVWTGAQPAPRPARRRARADGRARAVTSAKPGTGVELLRDGRDDTYWQSDGTQPHLVNIQFQKKVHVSQVRRRALGRPHRPGVRHLPACWVGSRLAAPAAPRAEFARNKSRGEYLVADRAIHCTPGARVRAGKPCKAQHGTASQAC